MSEAGLEFSLQAAAIQCGLKPELRTPDPMPLCVSVGGVSPPGRRKRKEVSGYNELKKVMSRLFCVVDRKR